ncbi:permease [Carnobacterium maltaromaticum]|uniref:MFS transporter n=1 Tax=Carnobacterium maltaromaticum TaxID=2751 RepID=UPI0007051FE9|nr:MFS transporter [Carnobacterium maltaromaticum]KRN86105.1 permease [Carnobacterium maltaromaticum]
MSENSYFSTVMALYINYILQGMAAIILAQNMVPLMGQLNTNAAGISIVISGIGFGRILILYFAGRMSDRYGRKKIVWLGMFSYVIFFGGILISQNMWMATFFTLFAGFANALLDTGTYPALMEAYPEANGFMSVLNKAFISLGQLILPIVVGFLIANNLYFGYSFILCLVALFANIFFMQKRRFPKLSQTSLTVEKEQKATKFNQKPVFLVEGLALTIFGFTSVSTFNIIVLWLPRYAEELAGMAKSSSLMLVSLYSVGSMISVFITAFLIKKWMQPITMILSCSIASSIVLILVILFPTPLGCSIAAFGIGIFSSGGIWQLALAILLEFFPENKGRMTSYYTLMTSFSVMLIPLITGNLSERNILYVFIFNCGITLASVIVAVLVAIRYRKLTNLKKAVEVPSVFQEI